MSRLPLLALFALLALATPSAYAQADPSGRYGDQPLPNYQQDRLIHDQVHDAIEGALGRQASRTPIRVEVRRGHVHLVGKVRDARARALAHRVAHDVPGVRSVSVRRLYASRW